MSPPPQKTKHATSHQVQQKLLAEGTSENRLEMERLTTSVCESDRCKTKVRTTQEGTRKGNMYRHSRKRICRYRTPLPPNFNQCCEKRAFGGANFCPENARAHGCPKPCNIEIGGGGEGETKRKQKMWIEQWCELSSDTSSKKSACHRHEATAKANNGCQ